MRYELWILKIGNDGNSHSFNDELVATFELAYKDLAIEFARKFIDGYKVPEGFEECQILLETVEYDDEGNAENVDTLIDASVEKEGNEI